MVSEEESAVRRAVRLLPTVGTYAILLTSAYTIDPVALSLLLAVFVGVANSWLHSAPSHNLRRGLPAPRAASVIGAMLVGFLGLLLGALACSLFLGTVVAILTGVNATFRLVSVVGIYAVTCGVGLLMRAYWLPSRRKGVES